MKHASGLDFRYLKMVVHISDAYLNKASFNDAKFVDSASRKSFPDLDEIKKERETMLYLLSPFPYFLSTQRFLCFILISQIFWRLLKPAPLQGNRRIIGYK